MFRPLRRTKRAIADSETKLLLKTERRGVFAVNGDDGYPYAVPVNYYYDEKSNKIFFHGARAGHKFDSINKCDKVCFTVYGNETVPEDEKWAPYMQSVVVFGRCRLITDYESVEPLVRTLAEKYYPDKDSIEEEISKDGRAVTMYEITIEHLTGKQVQEK